MSIDYISMSMCQSVDYCKGFNVAVDEILPKYRSVVAELEEAHNEIEQLKARVAEVESGLPVIFAIKEQQDAHERKIKADAIREAFSELANEYSLGGLRHMYTGFAISQHIEAQSKYYINKLEAGTL